MNGTVVTLAPRKDRRLPLLWHETNCCLCGFWVDTLREPHGRLTLDINGPRGKFWLSLVTHLTCRDIACSLPAELALPPFEAATRHLLAEAIERLN